MAFLALLFRIAVPPGFMIGDHGSVVICTGHGPMQMAGMTPGKDDKAPKEKAEHACPFAVNAVPPLGADDVRLTAPLRAALETAPAVWPDLTPGLGLAAPPPPSHAPPSNLA